MASLGRSSEGLKLFIMATLLSLQAYNRLTGEDALPWDEECLSEDDRRKLGVFWKPIQKLLTRNLTEQATAHDFSRQCLSIFSKNIGNATHTFVAVAAE